MDPTKARLNEINFLELCARIESVNHRPIEIKKLLNALHDLFEFDLLKLNEITDKIFTPRLQVHKFELTYLFVNGYISSKEAQIAFSKSPRTLQRLKNNPCSTVLYPKLDPEEQEALDIFMQNYDKYFTKSYLNIMGVEREDII